MPLTSPPRMYTIIVQIVSPPRPHRGGVQTRPVVNYPVEFFDAGSVGFFCMLVILRGLVSKHLTDIDAAFCTPAACEASWFRPGGLTCDRNIHIHIVLLLRLKILPSWSAGPTFAW